MTATALLSMELMVARWGSWLAEGGERGFEPKAR